MDFDKENENDLGDHSSDLQTLRQVFGLVRGLADDVNFARNPSTARSLNLAEA